MPVPLSCPALPCPPVSFPPDLEGGTRAVAHCKVPVNQRGRRSQGEELPGRQGLLGGGRGAALISAWWAHKLRSEQVGAELCTQRGGVATPSPSALNLPGLCSG